MLKKLTLSLAAILCLTAVGCVSHSGGYMGARAYDPCSPCGASYECSPCESATCTACQPAAPCESASCTACQPAAPCEAATCNACQPAAPCEACMPSSPCGESCGVPACGNSCSYEFDGCSTGNCGCGMRNHFGQKATFGSENGLFSSLGYGQGFGHGHAKGMKHGVFGRGYDNYVNPDEMYVTRGPRDFFDPNPNVVR